MLFFYLILLLSISVYSSVNHFQLVVNYLNHYGYLNLTTTELFKLDKNSTIFIEGLKTFQQRYNLQNTSEINKEVINFVQKYRCGVEDVYFRTHPIKWGNNTIYWNFYGNIQEQNLVLDSIKIAFEVWANHTNLHFIEVIDPHDATILISFGTSPHHYSYFTHNFCNSIFDGPGNMLGHAEYPNTNMQSEVHLDSTENWSYELVEPPNGEISLFDVLVHEIGHSLGIEHSNIPDSIMFPAYNNNVFKNGNGKPYGLSVDDINAIQSLYGKRNQNTIPTTTTTKYYAKPNNVITEATIIPNFQPNLCKLTNVNKFLVLNKKLYIFYNEWVWIKNLNEKNFNETPYLLTDWLNFIPKFFKKLNAIYQRPNGNVVIIIDDVTYNIKFPSLQLESTQTPYISRITNINGAVSTNNGQTYIFYQNNSYIKINECEFNTEEYGTLDSIFPGVPNNIESVFKYTNGRIYFFINNYYYEFNEFTKSLEKAEKFEFSLFNISCPNISLYEQLKILLSKLINNV